MDVRVDYKESWVPNNWCFWTVVLEKTLDSPLDFKIKPVNPKGNQSWIFTAEVEAPILWPPNAKNWLSLEKTLMLGKIEGRRRREQQRKSWLNATTNSMDMSLSKLWSWWWTGKPGMLQSIGWAKNRTQLSEWPELNLLYILYTDAGKEMFSFFFPLRVLNWDNTIPKT